MRKNILNAGFLSTIIILVTFTSIAASSTLESDNVTDKENNRYSMKAFSPLGICDRLEHVITVWRNNADKFREKANEHPDVPAWVNYYTKWANICDIIANRYQYIYDVVCT